MLIRLIVSIESKKLEDILKKSFQHMDVMLECYGQQKSSWQKVIRSCGDIIVISESMIPKPTDVSIAMLNDLPENPTTIVVVDDSSSEVQTRLVTEGADVVLYSGISPKSMVEAIQSLFESRIQYSEKTPMLDKASFNPKISDFISNSDTMQVFMHEASQFIPSKTPLLLMGETGVGKEHLAKAMHNESPRAGGPFVTVNAAALPEQLLESELFGHTQGAFTGAMRSRRGAFEMAHHGTIFLDEIGEMPLHLQAKLLRTLQDYEVKPVGGEKSIWVDVRVIAATNRNLEEEVLKKNFRQDLFYRLGVITLTIPPLRERKEDIPTLANEFLERHRVRFGSEIEGVSENAMEALSAYNWPGNVRELNNVLERAVILCKGNIISLSDLPSVFDRKIESLSFTHSVDASSWKNKSLKQVVEETTLNIERLYIEGVLKETGGKIKAAADIAGINTRSLYNKMKKLGFDKKDFKSKK